MTAIEAGQHAEGDAALGHRQPEVVGDGREQGRQHLLARGRDEVRQAEQANTPQWGRWRAPTRRRPVRCRSPRRAGLVHFAYSMQSREWPAPPRRRDRSPSCSTPHRVTDAVGDAFAAWGRGEAATTQRVRAAAGGLDGERDGGGRAAVLRAARSTPPRNGAFTFVIVLFDAEGRLPVHARRRRDHPPAHAGRVGAGDPRTWPSPTARPRR